jgi:hypothetical protein
LATVAGSIASMMLRPMMRMSQSGLVKTVVSVALNPPLTETRELVRG